MKIQLSKECMEFSKKEVKEIFEDEVQAYLEYDNEEVGFEEVWSILLNLLQDSPKSRALYAAIKLKEELYAMFNEQSVQTKKIN